MKENIILAIISLILGFVIIAALTSRYLLEFKILENVLSFLVYIVISFVVSLILFFVLNFVYKIGFCTSEDIIHQSKVIAKRVDEGITTFNKIGDTMYPMKQPDSYYIDVLISNESVNISIDSNSYNNIAVNDSVTIIKTKYFSKITLDIFDIDYALSEEK